MLDQSFSPENFRIIFDVENRKGNYLEGKYFSNIKNDTIKIKQITAEYKIETREEKKAELACQLERLKARKEEKLENRLTEISEKVNNVNFQPVLKATTQIDGKNIYSYQESVACYFGMKQIQYCLKKIYKIKPANRNNIICHLKCFLGDGFPKQIIRTDISSFYESINNQHLINQIRMDGLLNPTALKIIIDTIELYKKLANTPNGLPRGIGISAYLSELYMRRFDEYIKSQPQIFYYARYVDDLIIIYADDPCQTIKEKKDLLEQQLKEMGLKINPKKTTIINTSETQNYRLEYLGYLFNYNGSLKISLTNSKIDRYKKKIDASFEDYYNRCNSYRKTAQYLLLKRLKFLTSNTRLLGNKKNIKVGTYFSNSHLTDISGYKELDRYLQEKVDELPNTTFKEKLTALSFKCGFENQNFYIFNAKSLIKIQSAWKKNA